MNTSETEAVTGEVLSRFAALQFFKNKSFAKLCNLSVTAKKKKTKNKERKQFNCWACPYPPERCNPPQIAYQNDRAGLRLITFHILTTKFTKGFTLLVSHSSCLLLILQKLPGHSSQGADTLGGSNIRNTAFTTGIKALLHTSRALNHIYGTWQPELRAIGKGALGLSAPIQGKSTFFYEVTR